MEKLAWLDARFVQNVLQKSEKDESIEVSGIIVKPATAKGDNDMSDIYRVTVALSRIHNECKITETTSILAKVIPENPLARELVLDARIFHKEISMMTDMLPKMNGMLAGSSNTSLAARCLAFQSESPMYLIIEDLAPRGFRIIERGVSLDLEHSLLTIRNIARFHAASVALAEKDQKVTECVLWSRQTHKGLENPIVIYNTLLRACTKALGEEAVNWPELSPRISEKIIPLSEIIHEKQWKATDVSPEAFNVLNHGDNSLRNMLFRYDERQKPIEQIFVDFQHSYYGSPACDILSFLGSSTSIDVRFDDRELLLREYHGTLTSTMEKLKCTTKAPSFGTLQDILRKGAFHEIIPTFVLLPYILVDKKDGESIQEFAMSGETSNNAAYKTKMYRKMMTRILPVFDSMGLLDV